jgi:outer membrane protein, heavy metal efflux system
MSNRWAALLAVVAVSCGTASARSPKPLTLQAAFERTLEKHPDLARSSFSREAARAAVDAAAQSSPLRLGLEIENAPRSGQESSLDSAEATLSLASVFERGGKRDARRAVADAAYDALCLQEEQRRADLLAEVARRYLDLIAVQSLWDLASVEVTQREMAAGSAAQRVRAGATPESVRLAAEAAAVRATLRRDRLRAQTQAAARRLAVLWNSREPDFDAAQGDLLALPHVSTLEDLRELVEGSPELRRFADESRLREARLQLARSARARDIEWQIGVRRFEEDGSWGAVIGASIPLGNADRAAPGIRAAQAELAALSLEREAEALTLEATLIDAHLQLTRSRDEVVAARDVLIPRLDLAERASERAFRAGALTFLEWSQVQSELMSARHEQLLAAIEAHRALIEIQRLTGSPFVEAMNTRTQP